MSALFAKEGETTKHKNGNENREIENGKQRIVWTSFIAVVFSPKQRPAYYPNFR